MSPFLAWTAQQPNETLFGQERRTFCKICGLPQLRRATNHSIAIGQPDIPVARPTKTNKPERTMKRIIITTIAALALCAAFVPTAEAKEKKPKGEGKKADPEEAFKKLDKDGDGSISKEEFTAHGKDKAKAEAAFAKKDTNGDGKLSKEEFMAHGKKKNK
jgi:EF-hand domain pair